MHFIEMLQHMNNFEVLLEMSGKEYWYVWLPLSLKTIIKLHLVTTHMIRFALSQLCGFYLLWLSNVVYLIEQVSMGFGTITAHALMSLEARGTLFVNPGMEVRISYLFHEL